MKEMRDQNDEVILPADKANTTVTMERENYDRNVRELLDDTYLLQTTEGPQESKIST